MTGPISSVEVGAPNPFSEANEGAHAAAVEHTGAMNSIAEAGLEHHFGATDANAVITETIGTSASGAVVAGHGVSDVVAVVEKAS